MDAPRPPLDVLVADADAGVGELLLAVLRRAGLRADRVSEAGALHAALDAPEGARPRALLVERALPGCHAAELHALLDARGLALPLLVTTAYLEPHERRALCDAPGVVGVVDKPFDLARLIADVTATLALASGARPTRAHESPDAVADDAVVAGAARAWFPGASCGVPPGEAPRARGLERGAGAC